MTEYELFTATLKPFLNALSEWISAGCPNSHLFKDNVGICNNYNYWLRSAGHDRETVSGIIYDRYLPELFKSEGLYIDYPFNDDEWSSYMTERFERTIYKNPERLAWIESHK